MASRRYVSPEDVFAFVENELYSRRTDRYEIVSFDDMKDIVTHALDSAGYVEVPDET